MHRGSSASAVLPARMVVGVLLLVGCHERPTAPSPCASCERAKLANLWCDHCQVGYVAGVPIKSKILFEAMDAHGHDLVLSTFTCPRCKTAIAEGGFCEKCRIGWVNNKAYFSRLTYHLAHGTPCDPATLACATCRENAKKYGWCAACGQGLVGNVIVKRRSDFDGGRRGFDLMMRAIEASQRCETCALAMLTDTSCFFCKITYREGKPVQPSSRPSAVTSSPVAAFASGGAHAFPVATGRFLLRPGEAANWSIVTEHAGLVLRGRPDKNTLLTRVSGSTDRED